MSKKCYLLLFVLLLCLSQTGYSPGLCAEHPTPSYDENKMKQVGAFAIKDNAERFAEKLRNEGFEVDIREVTTEDNETIYRVFARETEEHTSEVASAQGIRQDTSLEQEPEKDEHAMKEEVSAKPDRISGETLSSEEGREIVSFKVFREKEDAEEFAQKLREEGFEVYLHKTVTREKSALYTVFAERSAIGEKSSEEQKEPAEVAVAPAETEKPTSEVGSAQSVRRDTSLEQEPEKDEHAVTEEVSKKSVTVPRDVFSVGGKIASFKVFREKEDAEEFAQKLREEGFEVSISEPDPKDKILLYSVFAEKPKGGIEEGVAGPSLEVGKAVDLAVASEQERPAAGEKSSEEQKEPAEVAVAPVETGEPASEIASAEKTQQQDIISGQRPLREETESAENVLAKPGPVFRRSVSSEGGKQLAVSKIFQSEKDAEVFARQLREEGFEVYIRRPEIEEKGAHYTVYAEKPKELIEIPESSPEVTEKAEKEVALVEGPPVPEEIPSDESREPTKVAEISVEEGGKDSGVTAYEKGTVIQKESGELKGSSKPGSLVSEVVQGTSSQEPSYNDERVEKERITADIFGRRGGYLHPFLSVTGYFTDNVFNTPDNEKSDFVTVLSPGVWLSVPRVKQKLLNLNTSTMAPGGYRMSRASGNFFSRYQAYLLYGMDVELFSRYDSENFLNHRVEGLLQYNFRGGLTVEFVDQFLISHDIRGTGISTELDKYRSNLANIRFRYDTGHRLNFQVDYANFLVDYQELRNDFRHRNDNSVSGYIFYRLKPKTSAFVQYQYIDVNYRDDILSNSQEHNIFGGISWDITAKSKGAIKAGYGTKDFNDSSIDSGDYFILEVQIDHRFTPKTSALLNVWRKTNETNISTTDYIVSHGIELGYNQQFTGRIQGNARFSYIFDRYKGLLTYGGETKERRDNYYMGTIGLNYKFREWLATSIGYTFTDRNSNFYDFDYENNMFWFNITGSL